MKWSTFLTVLVLSSAIVTGSISAAPQSTGTGSKTRNEGARGTKSVEKTASGSNAGTGKVHSTGGRGAASPSSKTERGAPSVPDTTSPGARNGVTVDGAIAGATEPSRAVLAENSSDTAASPGDAIDKGKDGQLLGGKLFGDGQSGKLPTFVKSDTLTLKGNERVFAYEGNVEVQQGDMTLTAAVVEGSYDENNKIQNLTARTNVIIVKGEGIRASGEKAVFDNNAQVVTLTENPELQQEGSVLTADVIKVFMAENRSAAEGNVRVKLVKKENDATGAPARAGPADLSSFVR